MLGFLIQSPVEHYAETTPDHSALSYQGMELSYSDLNAKSNQLANALIGNGAAAQDRVAIYMHKSLDLGVAIYAILKAGCIFVPIDPFMPTDRLAFIMDDCDIKQIICSKALVKSLDGICQESDIKIFGFEDSIKQDNYISPLEIANFPTNSPDINIIDQDLGYIMYTSGSTGSPKGMMHSHHGSISYARWGAEHVSLSATDRVASHAPLHFDLSIFDFFSTAQAGATVVIVPEAVARFPASWTKTIESERISVVFTVPYTLITMTEQGVMDQRDLSSLRWVLYGGEPFPPAKLRTLMLKLKQVKFTNVYGPAEAPSCTCYDVPLPEEGNNDPIPIGHVSKNSLEIIIDHNDKNCVDDSAGELCIRSSTLTHGYWKRPDLNSAAFLLRAGLGHFPTTYYRTGDRVVRDSTGHLHFLGRVDRMIKVRGQRVELDEVESVLSSHQAVFEAAAITVPDGSDSNMIVAAIALKTGEKLDKTELLRLARAQLSAYAVPTEIIFMPDLPHNSSGKIDRKTLVEQWPGTTLE